MGMPALHIEIAILAQHVMKSIPAAMIAAFKPPELMNKNRALMRYQTLTEGRARHGRLIQCRLMSSSFIPDILTQMAFQASWQHYPSCVYSTVPRVLDGGLTGARPGDVVQPARCACRFGIRPLGMARAFGGSPTGTRGRRHCRGVVAALPCGRSTGIGNGYGPTVVRSLAALLPRQCR